MTLRLFLFFYYLSFFLPLFTLLPERRILVPMQDAA
jgi:hypothetical protein